MSKPTLYSEAYRIAEEAHKGCDEDYIMDLCDDAAREFNTTTQAVYNLSNRLYGQHFESR